MVIGALLTAKARRWAAIVGVIVVVLAVLVTVNVSSAAAPVRERDVTIPVAAGPGLSGTINLDASLFLPAVTPAPAVIVAHGFGGSKDSVKPDAERYAQAGFVVLTYSARGFGRSGGQIGLDSLDYEVADARALVTWLGRQPSVELSKPGDPVVGVTGGSYGGALALMLAGTDPRIDAVAAVATWNNLDQALFPDGLTTERVGTNPPSPGSPPGSSTPAFEPGEGGGVFKQAWTASLLTSILAAGPATTTHDASAGGAGTAPSGDATPSKSGTGTGLAADPTQLCGRLMPDLCAAYLQVATSGQPSPEMSALLAKSSPDAVTDHITAPTLLVQGEQDTLFGLGQADANARQIAAHGTTVAVSWYPGGHSGGGLDTVSEDRITAWLQYYLMHRGPKPSTEFQYAVAGSVSQRGTPRVRTLEVPGYPGLGHTDAATSPVTVHGPAQVVANPPGGQPSALTSLPGVATQAASVLGGLATLPGQAAQFESDPVTTPLVVTGSTKVTLKVSRVPGIGGGSTAPIVLYLSQFAANPATQVSAQGAAPSGAAGASSAAPAPSVAASDGASDGTSIATALAGGGGPAGGAVMPIRIDDLPVDGSPVTVTAYLPAVAFQVNAGQAFGIRVATTDQAFVASKEPAAYRVSLASGTTATLAVPAVGGIALASGESAAPWAVGLAVLVVIGVAALIWVGRDRRRAASGAAEALSGVGYAVMPDPESPRADAASTNTAQTDTGPADTAPTDHLPLVVAGLRKQYPGGVLAVDAVSFVVKRGQVLGLLGPNGAGKTTTLRMVMGLITPTAGEIRLFGEPVTPGAAVLRRVGSFVEGSGFLPHLSGRANLELYWRATGRPPEESYLQQALAIAGLDAAITRRVRTYSQGMRQRLAIAQAMLGLPELLILDEPTNGLDPPQIHAMRAVLRRYAATGRTVVVSSHLLSEVEQTCTDVVIVSRGRTIAAGTVAEMVARAGDLVITTTDPAAARQAVAAVPGVAGVEDVAGGLAVDRGTADVPAVMRSLVDAGVSVTAIAPRNRLEEVFLDLIAARSAEEGPRT